MLVNIKRQLKFVRMYPYYDMRSHDVFDLQYANQ